MKFCKDCKYYWDASLFREDEQIAFIKQHFGEEWFEEYPHNPPEFILKTILRLGYDFCFYDSVSLISGQREKSIDPCDQVRSHDGDCGIEARFFEEKEG